jgi:hypothetical protein
MAYDDRARATAIRMLALKADGGKGQAVTLTRAGTGSGSRNATTGVYTPAGAATQTGSGIEDVYKAHEIDGTLILSGDMKFMLSPVTSAGADIVEPPLNSTVTYSGKTKTVKAVERVAPAGVVAYYVLQVRG